VRADPGGQQLVGAEPQDVEQRGVDVGERAGAARGEHGVVAAAAAERAVGQLGGQRGVAACQPALGQQGGEQQVGIGVPVGHRAQHGQRHLPGRGRGDAAAGTAGVSHHASDPLI